jgi:hypothetical protein
MSILTRFLGRPAAPLSLPDDMTAALEPMFTDGTSDGCGVALTGMPELLGLQTGADGVRYIRLRIGFAPDAHVTIRTPSAEFAARMAEEWIKAYDALNPVPSEMTGGAM